MVVILLISLVAISLSMLLISYQTMLDVILKEVNAETDNYYNG